MQFRLSWLVAVLAVVALLGAGAWLARFRSRPAELVFLAVGQGDSALLRAGGRNVLFDAGPPSSDLVDRLRQRGVSQLAMLVLTHPDEDHVGGVGALLRRIRVSRVAISDEFRDDPILLGRLHGWGVDSAKVAWLDGASVLRFGRTAVALYAPETGEDDNAGSVFAKIEHEGATAVLTGDAPIVTEDEVAALGDWSAQVLKAGHHGSAGSTGEGWLDEVRPTDVVVSCGRDNRYDHPSEEFLARVQRRGLRVYRTDRQGDLAFTAQNGRFVRAVP